MYEGPPDNNTQWYDLIYQVVSHLVERYGAEEVSTYWMICRPIYIAFFLQLMYDDVCT